MEQFQYYTNDFLDDVYIPEMDSDTDSLPDSAAARGHDINDIVALDNSSGLANTRKSDLPENSHSRTNSINSHFFPDEFKQGREHSEQQPYKANEWPFVHNDIDTEGPPSESDPKYQGLERGIWEPCENMGKDILLGSMHAARSLNSGWPFSLLGTEYSLKENPVEPDQKMPVEPSDQGVKVNRDEATSLGSGVAERKGLNQLQWFSKDKEFPFLGTAYEVQPCGFQKASQSNTAPIKGSEVQSSVIGQCKVSAEGASSYPQNNLTSSSLPQSLLPAKLQTVCGQSDFANTDNTSTVKSQASFPPADLPEITTDFHPAGQSFQTTDLPVESEPEDNHPEDRHSSLDNLDLSGPDSGQFWHMVQQACDTGNTDKDQYQILDATGKHLPTSIPDLITGPLADMLSVNCNCKDMNSVSCKDDGTVHCSQDQGESAASNTDSSNKDSVSAVSQQQQGSQSSSGSEMQLLTSQDTSCPVEGMEDMLELCNPAQGKKRNAGAKGSGRREPEEDETRHFGIISELAHQNQAKSVEDHKACTAHHGATLPDNGNHVKSPGSESVDADRSTSQDLNTEDSARPYSKSSDVELQNPVRCRKDPVDPQKKRHGTSRKGQSRSAVPKGTVEDRVMGANNQHLQGVASTVKQGTTAARGVVSTTSSEDFLDSTEYDTSSMAVEIASAGTLSSLSQSSMVCLPRSLSTFSDALSSLTLSCKEPQMALRDQTLTEANIGVKTYRVTTALEEAEDALSSPDFHRIFLIGLPGSGKQTLARALLRRCKELEHMPLLVIKSFSEWRKFIGGKNGKGQGSVTSQVLLLDHIFGQGMLKNFEEWRQVFDVMAKFCEQGKTKLIFTLYPHVLQVLRETEPSCKLFSKQCEVQMKDMNLCKEEKESMLRAHLQSNQDAAPYVDSLVQEVGKVDNSGEMFPGCCNRLASFLRDYHSPSAPLKMDSADFEQRSEQDFKLHYEQYLLAGVKIFSRPSSVYKDFFSRILLEDRAQQEQLLAAFSLLLNGMDLTQIHSGTDRVAEVCRKLRFGAVCSQNSLLLVLRSFRHMLVAGDCRKFVNRHAYEGVALAVAQYNASLPILMADWEFLIKRCVVPLRNANIDDAIKPFVVIVKRVTSERKITSEYQALVHRLAEGLMNPAHMVWAVQHEVLQTKAFLEDMMPEGDSFTTQLKLLSATFDSIHNRPLLFWSLFNASGFFFQWIFKTVPCHHHHRKVDLVLSAYICCVLKERSACLKLLLRYWEKFTSEEVKHLLEGKHNITHPFLPLPSSSMCLNESWMSQLKHINSVQKSMMENSCTLNSETGTCIAPQSSHSLQKTRVGGGETQKERDRKGLQLFQPPLHLAVCYENIEVVDLLAEFAPELLCVKDHSDKTALHVAAQLGRADIAQTLLRHCLGLTSMEDSLGYCPLHVACDWGQIEVAQLLKEADSCIAKRKNRFGLTPIDLALQRGCSDLC